MANGNLNHLAKNIAEATAVYAGDLTKAGKFSGDTIMAMAERFALQAMEGVVRDNTFEAPPLPKIGTSHRNQPVYYTNPQNPDEDYIIHVTKREKDEQK